MAPIDQYRDLGHSPTNMVDFSLGNYYGEALSEQGWGGAQGRSFGTMGSGYYDVGPHTTEDLMGSLWNATPDNSAYGFINVNGDWYHTSTTFVMPYEIGPNKAASGGVPLTTQGNGVGQPVGGNSTTQFFSNTTDAYNYMWKNSFDAKGNARNEVSAWQTSNGVIVMPYYKNSLRISYNDYLPVKTINGQKNVFYNDSWNVITGHIHTHPSYNNGYIGVSGGDYDMGLWLKMPTTILWNNRIWQINGRGSSPVDLGTW